MNAHKEIVNRWHFPVLCIVGILMFVAADPQCYFPQTNQFLENYCEWTHWLPWDCSCDQPGLLTQKYAVRKRGICCNDIETLDQCIFRCGYEINADEERKPCSTACRNMTTMTSSNGNLPPATFATAVSTLDNQLSQATSSTQHSIQTQTGLSAPSRTPIKTTTTGQSEPTIKLNSTLSTRQHMSAGFSTNSNKLPTIPHSEPKRQSNGTHAGVINGSTTNPLISSSTAEGEHTNPTTIGVSVASGQSGTSISTKPPRVLSTAVQSSHSSHRPTGATETSVHSGTAVSTTQDPIPINTVSNYEINPGSSGANFTNGISDSLNFSSNAVNNSSGNAGSTTALSQENGVISPLINAGSTTAKSMKEDTNGLNEDRDSRKCLSEEEYIAVIAGSALMGLVSLLAFCCVCCLLRALAKKNRKYKENINRISPAKNEKSPHRLPHSILF